LLIFEVPGSGKSMLRFGDGTPFPLDESFLEVLVNAVGACTAMLTATAHMEARHARARAKQQVLLEEARTLERFEQTVRMAAAGGAVPQLGPRPTEQAFEQTVAAMQHALTQAREQLTQAVAANTAEFGRGEAPQQVELAVGRFFECHVLPGSVWTWSWDATPEQPSFEATAHGARFTVDYDLEQDAPWQAPIRIATLAPGIVLDLPRRRWLQQPVVRTMLLDRHVLVGARFDEEGWRLEIQEREGAAPGWRITLPRSEAATATAFDGHGRAIAIYPVMPEKLAPLLAALDQQVRARLGARRVRTVLLGGIQVSQFEDTTTAARALLDEIGPIVREIRTRSRVPGELSLKRDVAAGVREEIFVSRVQLAACYASLPPQYRYLLDAIGVGRGLTGGVGEPSTEAAGEITTGPAPDARTERAPEARPRPSPPPRPSRPIAHPPPVPRRSQAGLPTVPVKSLRAVPTQSSAGKPMPWMGLRAATPAV
jgi:hypothetical protein